jgi:two-component system response regulator AtoC
VNDIATHPSLVGLQSAYLVVLGHEIRRHAIPVSGELVLGRSDDCAIAIDDPSVSRRHAVISIANEGFTIRDLSSSNGTRVRGAPVGTTPVPFVANEVVQLATASIVIHRVGQRVLPSGSPMDRVRALLDRIAAGTISVLIIGETGVGKEVLAEAVHQRSPRASHPFVCLNCAALSETLLESELFGYEKGAFTGAERTKPGLLETANEGTVFLDEIGEMPLSTQVKLLRVIEQRQVMRVGGLAPRPIDVRFVAATHRDLPAEISAGRFRQDLYFRINGITLAIPPLRSRLSELESLTKIFLERGAAALHVPVPQLAPEAAALLRAHRWPGNIRELRNVIERAVLLAAGGTVLPEHILLEVDRTPPHEEPSYGDTERARILSALARSAGNQKLAAELLGISRRTLSTKLDQHAIARPRKRV